MKDKTGPGCLGLFFMPFVLVGAGTFLYSAYYFIKSQQAKFWEEKVATIQFVDMEHGEDSSTIVAKYSYTVADKTYQGEKIGFGYSMNNIDNHGEIYDILSKAKKVMVYVNPNDPNESVLTTGINDSLIGMFFFSILWNAMLSVFFVPYFFGSKEIVGENLIFNIINPSTD